MTRGLALALDALCPLLALAQNYDESVVPASTLPDLLVFSDRTPVRDAKAWRERRRPELLALLEEQVYGKAPGRPEGQ